MPKKDAPLQEQFNKAAALFCDCCAEFFGYDKDDVLQWRKDQGLEPDGSVPLHLWTEIQE